MVSTGEAAGATEWVTGLWRYLRTSLSTSPSSVAENSSRCPLEGIWSSSAETAGMKPRSHMWSASSRTVICTSCSEQAPRSMRSVSRPGVATSRSTPRRSAWICLVIDMPPTTVLACRPTLRPSGASASWTCAASSRVGTRMSAAGRFGAAERPASLARSGSPKAIVLPEPVCPRPSTSRPARASGRQAAWIGNGVVMPRRSSAETSLSGMPSSANEGRVDEADVKKEPLRKGPPREVSAKSGDRGLVAGRRRGNAPEHETQSLQGVTTGTGGDLFRVPWISSVGTSPQADLRAPVPPVPLFALDLAPLVLAPDLDLAPDLVPDLAVDLAVDLAAVPPRLVL